DVRGLASGAPPLRGGRRCFHPALTVAKRGGRLREREAQLQGPVPVGASAPASASATTAFGTPRPPGGPLSLAANAGVATRPWRSTTAPPESPLITDPRNGVI